MSESSSEGPFSQAAQLRNGTLVSLRALGPQDREKIVTAFGKLDAQSVYTRFFSFKKELGVADLQRLEINDPSAGLALAAFIGSGADEVLIGAGSYVALPSADGARAAEVAFTIEEDYQGQRLASRLFAALADAARQHGFQRFEAEVLAGNLPMLSVFERSGLPLAKKREGGVVHVTMELGLSGAAP